MVVTFFSAPKLLPYGKTKIFFTFLCNLYIKPSVFQLINNLSELIFQERTGEPFTRQYELSRIDFGSVDPQSDVSQEWLSYGFAI